MSLVRLLEELIDVKKIQKGTCLYLNISRESKDKLRLKAGAKMVEKVDAENGRLIYEKA